MTKAEQWRIKKPKDWDSTQQYMDELFWLDAQAEVQSTDLGIIILFSDGSQHRMGSDG